MLVMPWRMLEACAKVGVPVAFIHELHWNVKRDGSEKAQTRRDRAGEWRRTHRGGSPITCVVSCCTGKQSCDMIGGSSGGFADGCGGRFKLFKLTWSCGGSPSYPITAYPITLLPPPPHTHTAPHWRSMLAPAARLALAGGPLNRLFACVFLKCSPRRMNRMWLCALLRQWHAK